MKRERKIHYGWIIILASFIIMGLSWSMAFNLPNLFITTLSEDLNVSRTAVNFSFTIRSICQLLVSVFAAKVFRRFGIHRVMKFFALVLLFASLLYSRIESLWGFYFCSTLIFLANFFITLIPLSIIINNWFNEKVGQVTGLAFMSTGIFTFLLSPILGEIISRYNWRISYIFLGFLVLILIVPAIFLLIKESPESVGMEAYGKYDGNNNPRSGRLLSEIKMEKSFWMLLIATLLANVAVAGLMPNIAPHLENLDFDVRFASRIFALVTLSLAFGKIVLGYVYDKKGSRTASVSAALGLCLGLISLAIILKSKLLFISLIVATGYGVALPTVGNQNITKELYGNKDYGNILSYFQIFSSLGSMVAPVVIGLLYDSSGTYLSSIILALFAGLLSALIFFIFIPGRSKE